MDSLFESGQHDLLAKSSSILSTAFGVWIFFRDGGDQVTAAGVYSFSQALFVGFSGMYLTFEWGPGVGQLPATIGLAIALCYFAHVLSWAIFWTRSSTPRWRLRLSQDSTRRTAMYGFALLGIAVALRTMGYGLSPMIQACGFVGVALVGIWAFCGASKRPLISALWAVGAFGIYVTYLFVGFGRIILATLAFSMVVMAAQRFNGKKIKACVLFGLVPLLMISAKVRVSKVEALNPGVSVKETGLESVLSPLRAFALLVDMALGGLLPHADGRTFFSAMVVLVPRSAWPEKPIGFGAELVPYLRPDLLGVGHSEAALLAGEFLFNFGFAGLLLMVLTVGFLIRVLDRLIAQEGARSEPNWIRSSALTMAAVGTIDLAWGGAFTFTSRFGPRLLIFTCVALLGAIAWRGTTPSTSTATDPSSTTV